LVQLRNASFGILGITVTGEITCIEQMQMRPVLTFNLDVFSRLVGTFDNRELFVIITEISSLGRCGIQPTSLAIDNFFGFLLSPIQLTACQLGKQFFHIFPRPNGEPLLTHSIDLLEVSNNISIRKSPSLEILPSKVSSRIHRSKSFLNHIVLSSVVILLGLRLCVQLGFKRIDLRFEAID